MSESEQDSGRAGSDRRRAHVPARAAGQRLDRFLAESFPLYSRRQLMRVVRAGHVRVGGARARPGTRLKAGDELDLPVWSRVIPAVEAARERPAASPAQSQAPIPILYEDEELLIVDKPAGVPVHGGAGIVEATLIDRLRERVLGGFGLVHRLDRDTSGAIALVRGEEARARVAAAFADSAGGTTKIYDALVEGVPEAAEGEIDQPLLPPGHGGQALPDPQGRPARTRWWRGESFGRAARLRVEPLTGRTHQIRAHLRVAGHPLLVDPLYGRRKALRIPDPRGGGSVHLKRTPLHARELRLPHPRTGKPIVVQAPLPADLKQVLEVLRIAVGRGRKRAGLPAPAPEDGGAPRA